jgi:putative membrane protein
VWRIVVFLSLLATILTGLVVVLHGYFLVLEMFLWATPYGQKTFGRSKEEQEQSKVLAKNQGLYNGFLAAGLVWGMVSAQSQVVIFFLVCVIIAGLYGAATAARKILFAQAIPAALALAAVLAAR